VPCQKGKYGHGGMQVCQDCEAGTYSVGGTYAHLLAARILASALMIQTAVLCSFQCIFF
jgi:hypothetical protein